MVPERWCLQSRCSLCVVASLCVLVALWRSFKFSGFPLTLFPSCTRKLALATPGSRCPSWSGGKPTPSLGAQSGGCCALPGAEARWAWRHSPVCLIFFTLLRRNCSLSVWRSRMGD